MNNEEILNCFCLNSIFSLILIDVVDSNQHVGLFLYCSFYFALSKHFEYVKKKSSRKLCVRYYQQTFLNVRRNHNDIYKDMAGK